MPSRANWFGSIELAPGAPSLDEGSLAARPGDGVQVTMRVAGGLPDQRNGFEFSLRPDGTATCDYVGDGRAGDSRGSDRHLSLEAPFLKELSLDLARSAATAPMRPPAFPPGSLIGQLLIDTPRGSIRTYFMADRQQAKTAGLTPPDEIQKFASTIYEACEDVARKANLLP